ncbi:NACHT domain-containing protein [Burkholderia cepacia]|uniref:NACHT domain-containing protein n=1 Tax=Burkholderia cepacia TaxID=292 RepID=UPI000A8D8C7A|nr:NACHT domain-containing protein [Burkholderia cepacia]
MPATTLTTTIIAAALKKPLEDAYDRATGAIKNLIEKWQLSGTRDSIAMKIEEIEKVRTIFKSDLVPLSSFYYPSRVRATQAGQPRTVTTLDEVAPRGNVVLYGTVGQGKSMFMRNLCAWELREGRRIPIFIELRNVDESQSLFELIRSRMEILGFHDLKEDSLDFLLSKSGFSIFLDGFDEVKRKHSLNSYQDLQKLIIKYPETRWVVSTRPGGMATSLQAIPGITKLALCELAEADYDPFLERLGVGESHRKRLIEAIKTSSTDVKGVLTTPLMLTLLNETFGVSANIPDSLHDFYEALFHVLACRHDDIKDSYQRERATALSNSELQESFEAFSFLSKDSGVSLTDSQFASCARDAAKLVGREFTADGFKNDLTNVVCLMAPDGLRTAFIHKSIQEFFAAFFIKGFTNTELVSQFYGALKQQRLFLWAQEIKFLEKLDRDRHVEHFLLPSINEFLCEISYSEKGVGLSKVNFFKFLNKLSLVVVRINTAKPPAIYYVSSVDSPIFNETTSRFITHCFPKANMMTAGTDLMESLKKSPDATCMKFESYFKGNPQIGDDSLTRARDFCERILKEKRRHEKNMENRRNDITRLFLGKK